MPDKIKSRRDFIKKTAYVAPAIMTFKAVSALASPGSMRAPVVERGDGEDPQPPVGDGRNR